MTAKEVTKNLITKVGYDKLLKELADRKDSIRKEIAEKIDDARRDGDLSENSAYTTAMEQKTYNDSRIGELEQIIATSQIIHNGPSGNKIGIGTKFKARLNGEQVVYTIVGVEESDPASGFISDQSPIGKEMIGKKKGESVKIKLPNGNVNEYEILDIL